MLLHCARRHPPLNSMENGTHFKTAQTEICCSIQISLSFCSYVLALSIFGKHSSDSYKNMWGIHGIKCHKKKQPQSTMASNMKSRL